MKRFLTSAILCLLVAGLGGVTLAQQTVDATLYGRVTDLSSGKPVANAAVIATSVFGAFTSETNASGEYRIPFLKPGSYDVRVEASNFATIIQQDVRLSLGGRTELNFSLAPGKVETMTVTSASPVVDHASTTTGANITEELMDAIPIGRNFNNTFYLAPGVNSSGAGNNNGVGAANPSISGGSGLENNFVVDGINITDSGFGALGAYSRVFGSLGTAVNYDFIKEVQVKTGGFEPEYGQSTGGVVNAITKSGSNSVSGDVFWYFTSRDLEGTRRITDTPNGDANVAPDGFQSNDIGITIGGPFVKDHFYWYVAYNRVEQDTDVFGSRSAFDASGTPTTPLFFDENNTVRREFEADNYSVKLTGQINPNHRIEVSAFGDPSERSFSGNRSSSLFVESNDTIAWSQLEFGGDNFILRYDGVITPNFLLEATAAQASSEFIESFPTINDQPAVRDRRVSPNEFLGGIGFFENTDHENNQFSLKLTNFIGNHELKYGIQYEDITFAGIRDRTGDTWTVAQPGADGIPGTADDPPERGQTTFSGPSIQLLCQSSLNGFPNATVDPTCGSAAILRVVRGEIASTNVETTTTYWAPFIQDAWQITPYFTFKYGIRYEEQEVSGGGSQGTSFTWDGSWAPRLGFTWDTAHNGKSKLYGSAGRFYSKVAQDLALRALSAEVGFTRGDYYWSDPVADTNGDGVINQVDGVAAALLNPVPTNTPAGTSRYIISGGHPTIVDEDAENSYADEYVLGYEYEVRPNLAIGARVMYRELGEILEDIAQNFASEIESGATTFGTYFITNPGTDTPAYHAPFTDPGVDGVVGTGDDIDCSGGGVLNFPGFITYDPTMPLCLPASVDNAFPDPERKYFSLELTMDKRLSNNWQLLASYRYSRLSGNYEGFFRSDNGQTDPNITSLFDFPDEDRWLYTYSNGVLPTDRTHILRFNGSYTFNFGSTLGISWNILSGAPLTTLDAHPVYTNSGELLVEPRGNSGRTPTQNIVDLHFDYPVKLGKTELKFFADLFNLFDESSTTGYDYDRETTVGVLNPDFGLAVATVPPRAVRVGAKFAF